MNPNSGELLAIANWPRINANDPSAAPNYANENRAVGYTYEPGSTFKAFTVAGALAGRHRHADTSFDLAPQIQVADRVIGESHPRGPETLTTAGILAQSWNVGAITIGLREGKDRFDKWVHRFGFGTPDRRRPARRGARPRPAAARSTRARRWATCRSARASR